jgi:hypothetical protein
MKLRNAARLLASSVFGSAIRTDLKGELVLHQKKESQPMRAGLSYVFDLLDWWEEGT